MARRRDDRRHGRGGPGGGQRQLRVGEELRHALAQLLRTGALRDPALAGANITVAEVRMSPDLRNATVFVMPLGGAHAAETVAGLRRSAPYLRTLLARAVPLRYTPQLTFALDTSYDAAERIAAVLARPEVERDLHSEDAADGEDEDAG